MKTLQERLREKATHGFTYVEGERALFTDAATALDTLEAEVVRLREWERVANERLELCNEAIQQRDQAVYVLEGAGFRRCDIPACNCNSWHQIGGFKARFDEIQEVVEQAGYSTNGRVLLDAVKQMAKDAATPLSAQEDVVEREPFVSDAELLQMAETAKRDDWHLKFVASDIRRLTADLIVLRASTERERGLEEAK